MKTHRLPSVREHATQTFLATLTSPRSPDFVVTSQEAARTLTRGELNLVICEACGLVFK